MCLCKKWSAYLISSFRRNGLAEYPENYNYSSSNFYLNEVDDFGSLYIMTGTGFVGDNTNKGKEPVACW